jgi:hypothetical protein
MSDPRRGVDAEHAAAAAAAQSNGGEGAAPLDHEVLVLAGVVVLGAIMSVLDTTIVNVALATVGRELHTSLSTVQWVSTGRSSSWPPPDG